MAMEGTRVEQLFVEFRADYAQFKSDMAVVRGELNTQRQAITGVKTSGGEMSAAMTGYFTSMLAPIALITAAFCTLKSVVDMTAESVRLAMDVTESENLFIVSMGNMEAATRAWSEELAEALGLNSYEIRRNVGLLYTMTQSMGVASDDALDMSKSVTQLAYDMASFYNLGTDEAFMKLRSGLTGEAEPLKQLGILVTENMAKQAAYRAGIVEEGAELDETTKVYGRYLAIMEQTTTAQGDMARTLDSPANAMRAMQAQMNELKLAWGEAFLPIVQLVVPVLTDFAVSLRVVADLFSDFTSSLFGKSRVSGLERNLSDVNKAAVAGKIQWDEYGKAADEATGKVAKAQGCPSGFLASLPP